MLILKILYQLHNTCVYFYVGVQLSIHKVPHANNVRSDKDPIGSQIVHLLLYKL